LKVIQQELLGIKFVSTIEQINELFANKSKEEIIKQYKFVDKTIITELKTLWGLE